MQTRDNVDTTSRYCDITGSSLDGEELRHSAREPTAACCVHQCPRYAAMLPGCAAGGARFKGPRLSLEREEEGGLSEERQENVEGVIVKYVPVPLWL